MSEPVFITLQRRFAAHLRDPQQPAPAGIEPRRMAVYRDLFWRNIEGFLGNSFPVLKSLLDTPRWEALVRGFFAGHRCQSGYFVDIPAQFLDWLQHGDYPRDDYPPFLLELACYEWLELALDVSRDEIPVDGVDPAGDLFAGVPLLNPLLVLVGSHWPLHQIAPDAVPETPLLAPVWLLVWRNRADRVQFMELNAASARLIQLLQEDFEPALTGAALLERLAAELGQTPADLRPFLGELLGQWQRRDIVLGTRS